MKPVQAAFLRSACGTYIYICYIYAPWKRKRSMVMVVVVVVVAHRPGFKSRKFIVSRGGGQKRRKGWHAVCAYVSERRRKWTWWNREKIEAKTRWARKSRNIEEGEMLWDGWFKTSRLESRPSLRSLAAIRRPISGIWARLPISQPMMLAFWTRS